MQHRTYVYGRVHGPGKKSRADVVNITDDMMQDELDALDLRGIPITEDHPTDQKTIAQQRNKIRGEIIRSFNGTDGSKYILGVVDTSTLSGCRTVAGIRNGEIGLSLGHIYSETQTETGELVSRTFAGDHVAICRSPRRRGCGLIAAGARSSYLEDTCDKKQGEIGSVIDQQQLVCASSSSTIPAPLSSNSSRTTSNMEAGGQGGASAPPSNASASGAGNTQQANPQQANGDTSMPDVGILQAQLLEMAEVVDVSAAREKKFMEDLALLTKERDEMRNVLTEKEKAEHEKLEKKRAEAEQAAKKTMDGLVMFLKNAKKAGGDSGNAEDDDITPESLMASLFPSNLRSEADMDRFKQLNTRTAMVLSNANSNTVNMVAENERMRQAFFKTPEGAENPYKRTRLESHGTGSNFGASSSSSSSSSSGATGRYVPTRPVMKLEQGALAYSSTANFEEINKLRAQMRKPTPGYTTPDPEGWRKR